MIQLTRAYDLFVVKFSHDMVSVGYECCIHNVVCVFKLWLLYISFGCASVSFGNGCVCVLIVNIPEASSSHMYCIVFHVFNSLCDYY